MAIRRRNRYALVATFVYAWNPLATIGWPKSTVTSKYSRPRGSARVSTILTCVVLSNRFLYININLSERSVIREPGLPNLGIHLLAGLFAVEQERDKGRLLWGKRERSVQEKGEKKREKVRSEREEARWLASIHWTRLRSRAASIDTTRVIVPPKGVCVAVIATVHHFLTSSLELLYLYFLVFSLQFNNWIYSTHCVECYRKGIQMSKWFIFVINIQVLLSLMLKCILT